MMKWTFFGKMTHCVEERVNTELRSQPSGWVCPLKKLYFDEKLFNFSCQGLVRVVCQKYLFCNFSPYLRLCAKKIVQKKQTGFNVFCQRFFCNEIK
jgi:hypothetical protein